MSVLNRPHIEAYVGDTGSGKGVSINKRLDAEKPTRLIIWDPRNEYARHARRFDELGPLVRTVATAKAGRFRFVPGGRVKLREAFQVWCDLAFTWGNCWVLCDELGDVTTPGWSPPGWRRVITQGRHQALRIIGAAQRPALIDKTFLGQATYLRCFALGYDNDVAAMAQLLRVPVEQVSAVQVVETATTVTLNYLERDKRAGTLQPGHIRLPKRPG